MTVEIPENFGIATMFWQWTTSAKQISVTCGYDDNSAPGTPIQTMADTIYGLWTANSTRPCNAVNMLPAWKFLGVKVLFHDGGGFVGAEKLVTITGTASGTAVAQPMMLPLVVTKQTAYRGKKFRGRFYPPMTYAGEGQVDADGTLATSERTTIQGFYDALLTAWAASDYPPYLLHNPTSPATIPTAITKLYVRPVVGTQRRRRARGA